MSHSWRSPLVRSPRPHGVWLAGLLAWAVWPGASVLQAADAPPAPFATRALRPFLEKHCLGCHDAATKKGGLDLENLRPDWAVPKDFEAWVKVHDKVRAGEMPPGPKRRPPEGERDALLRGLHDVLADADLRRQETDGRAVLRRLTRREYENSLRDLLDLPGLDVQDLLPEDGRAFGFDKVGTALDLSYVQLAKYLEAADVALEQATATQPRPLERVKIHLGPLDRGFIGAIGLIGKGTCVVLHDRKPSPDFPILSAKLKIPAVKQILAKTKARADAIGILQHESLEFRPRFTTAKPYYAGLYRVRISLWGFQWDRGRVLPARQTEAASLRIKNGRLLGYFDAPSLQSKVHEFVAWLNPGEEIGLNAASLPRVSVPQTKGNVAEFVGPGIAIDWFEIEGPLAERWPLESHRRLFGDLPLAALPADGKVQPPRRPPPPKGVPVARKMMKKEKQPTLWTVKSVHPAADAERLLNDFLPRAFRRPVPAKEVQRYVGLVQSQLREDVSFEEALRTAYKAALCSTDFLFLREPAGPLDDWALASRLSYFLWNSLPDRTLWELAQAGRLRDAATLRAQVERMLKDPKAERFVVDFLDQWLDLRDIEFTSPDRKLYPEFGPFLRDSMLVESRAYLRELLEHDLGVRHVVASDFVMLNQRMAQHYGIPGVSGPAFRKVPVPPDSHRGGFLTQASVLRVTANGTTTSPVKRGAWVMRQIVGEPPAPPPPNVPAVEPDIRGTVTIREQLSKHRSDRTCAACHAKIDPPGFALESFDVIGGWRERYRSLGEGDLPDLAKLGVRRAVFRLGLPVDASGETADGRPFHDVEGFKKLLLQDERRLARNLAGQFTVYATGAPVSFADRDEIERVLDRTRSSTFGLRSLIHEVVQSPMFRRK